MATKPEVKEIKEEKKQPKLGHYLTLPPCFSTNNKKKFKRCSWSMLGSSTKPEKHKCPIGNKCTNVTKHHIDDFDHTSEFRQLFCGYCKKQRRHKYIEETDFEFAKWECENCEDNEEC